MDEAFELPVTYRGETITLPAEFLVYSYTYKIKVDVYGKEVLFEPDEEGNYRAIVDPSLFKDNANISIELLRAITQSLTNITHNLE